jgi:hypothetical protein
MMLLYHIQNHIILRALETSMISLQKVWYHIW